MAPNATARSSPWIAVRDREAEREEKLEALLHAAARAFSANGYTRTSLESIAQQLGVTKPTLYYYCSGKADLIMQVALRGLDRIVASKPADLYASGLDQLRHTLRRYVEWVATDFGKCMVLLNLSDLDAPQSERIRQGNRAVDQQIRSLISKGIDDGSIAPCDIRLTAFMLASAINGVARWYKDDGGLTPPEVGEIYVNQMTSGLKPRS